jgi:uncharacterized membrane protein YedE/YeeE
MAETQISEQQSPRSCYLKQWMGLLFFIFSLMIFIWLNHDMPRLALFWIFGLVFGLVLQRSRFCFVSAFSNYVLFRDARLIKGMLVGLAIATLGFAAIMYRMVPDPSTGIIPLNAYVSPLGWHLVLAGLLFGLGMMLAGGCIMGNLYRLGEGSLSAVVALTGVIIGLGLLQYSWPLWWQDYILKSPQIWLPASLGWLWSIVLTLAVISILFWIVHHYEKHESKSSLNPHQTDIKTGKLFRWLSFTRLKSIFVTPWPLFCGGVILSVINILEYFILDRPWGITGEIIRWTEIIFNAINLPLPGTVSVPGT